MNTHVKAPKELMHRLRGVSKVMTAFVVLTLLAAMALVLNNGSDTRYLTADFEQVNSVYKGSDVKILGVAVGKVESLTPRGDVVRVKISYDKKIKLPSNVKAVVVSPSIVGDRFVQLAPAYTGGTALKDGGFLSVERTAVPVELDAIYKSLDDLSLALGPKGANKEGALSDLIDNTAKQFDGQGAQFNETIRNFAKLSTTLSDNKDELFGSVREVNDFVGLLKENDSTVRAFNNSTAKVSTVLEGEREDLAATLKALSLALIDIHGLVKENRGALRANIENLTSLSKVLARHADDVDEIMTNAPSALSNLAGTYSPIFGTINTRSNMGELVAGSLEDPASFLCRMLGESPTDGPVCPTLAGVLGNLPPPPALPRSAAASGVSPETPRSLREMLAVN